jgi:CRP-like cAMP-binding protein
VRLTTLEKVLHLRKVPLFSEMGGRELRRVAEIATQAMFEKDELIFSEGDPGSKLYIVVEGAVEIFIVREGHRTLLATVNSGRFFGEMSIFDLEPRSASAIARTRALCLSLSREDFRDLVYAFPSVVFPVLQHISRNLRRANEAEARRSSS